MQSQGETQSPIKGRAPKLSVVIPTYNERERLPLTLQEITPWLRQRFPQDFEIIVVDDNSPDGTGTLVLQFAQENPETRLLVQPGNIGKGAAVRRGCMEAHGKYVLFIDADHSTPIESLDQFMPHVETGVIGAVVGVRTYQEDECRWRRIIGLISQLLAHLVVFKRAVVDSQCGFKLFSKDVVARIFPLARVNGGMLDVELFYLLHKLNIPCRYVPVSWANKPGSRINIWLCMVRDPLDMVRIRVRDALGRYAKPVPNNSQPWS
jgi:dolichyl-phosphate beta-glucosyltransferase